MLHLKVHNTGADDLPPSLPGISVLHHLNAGLPQRETPAVVVVQGRRHHHAEGHDRNHGSCAIRRWPTARPPSRSRSRPARPTRSPPWPCRWPARAATRPPRRRSTDLRDRLIPATVGQVSGVEANVTGDTADNRDYRPRLMHRTHRWCSGSCLAWRSCCCWSRSARSWSRSRRSSSTCCRSQPPTAVLVWVFQDGHGASLLGFSPIGGVAPWLPLFLFVILFGLSMDYHVFILSRIKELVDGGMSTEEAVAKGIKSTAGVVTSAAIVMVGVFGIFATLSLDRLQGVRRRAGLGHPDRRHHHSRGAAARLDGAPRRLELVPAQAAAVAAAGQHRGRSVIDPGGLRGLNPPATPTPRRTRATRPGGSLGVWNQVSSSVSTARTRR